MAKPSNRERQNFRRTVVSRKSTNLAKRYLPRGGVRR